MVNGGSWPIAAETCPNPAPSPGRSLASTSLPSLPLALPDTPSPAHGRRRGALRGAEGGTSAGKSILSVFMSIFCWFCWAVHHDSPPKPPCLPLGYSLSTAPNTAEMPHLRASPASYLRLICTVPWFGRENSLFSHSCQPPAASGRGWGGCLQ